MPGRMKNLRLAILLLLFYLASCIGQRPHTSFTIERDLKESFPKIEMIFSNIESYDNLTWIEEQPFSSYLVFFSDATFLGPVIGQSNIPLDDLFHRSNTDFLYSAKHNWGRWNQKGAIIEVEIMEAWFNPAIHYRYQSGTLQVLNDTLKSLEGLYNLGHPRREEELIKAEGFLNSKRTLFYRNDTLDLSFIDPSKAWINKE
jgi:hypothetical protein